MSCFRCEGLTVPELLREGGTISRAWRCIQCGDIADPIIVHNRLLTTPPAPSRARTTSYSFTKWDRTSQASAA